MSATLSPREETGEEEPGRRVRGEADSGGMIRTLGGMNRTRPWSRSRVRGGHASGGSRAGGPMRACRFAPMKRELLVFAAILLAATQPGTAQRAPARFALEPVPTSSVVVQSARSGGSAFLIEAAGGIAGSLAGFALVYSAADDCEPEDLACDLGHAGAAVGVSTAAAAGGVFLAGRLGKTDPSGVGAALGALVGAVAGLGMAHLVTEELNVVNSDAGAIITYSVTQGIVAALGSRIARGL